MLGLTVYSNLTFLMSEAVAYCDDLSDDSRREMADFSRGLALVTLMVTSPWWALISWRKSSMTFSVMARRLLSESVSKRLLCQKALTYRVTSSAPPLLVRAEKTWSLFSDEMVGLLRNVRSFTASGELLPSTSWKPLRSLVTLSSVFSPLVSAATNVADA